MLQGSFVSLSIGFVAVSIELAIGLLLGGLAGFYGGRVDALIMRFTDVMLCFPTFFLILTVVALLPPSIWNIMIVIGVTSWMGTCRFVRAELMALREQDFVRAARALGLSDARIIFRHMVPNAIAPVLVSATIARGERDPDRVRALLPRLRRAAAERELGEHPGRRPHLPVRRALAVRRSRASRSWSWCWPSTWSARACATR